MTKGRRRDRRGITHLVTSLDPRHGGVARIVPALVDAQDSALPEQIELDGGRYTSIDLLSESRFVSINAGDVLHLHGLWELPLARAAWSAGSGYVFWTPHGMLDRWSRQQKAWKKWAAWKLYQGRLLRNATGLIVNTAQELEEARDWIGDVMPPHAIIPNGVDPPSARFLVADSRRAAANEWREAHSIPCGAPLSMFFGRLHEKKGVGLLPGILANVAESTPDVALAVVGEAAADQAEFVDRVRREFEERGLASRVHWIGFVDGDNRWAALAAADVVLFPSAEEGMSMALLESLASGCCVIATPECRMGGAQAAGALVEAPRLPGDFANAATELLAAPARRREVAERAARFAAEHHRWDVVARQTLEFYQRAIKTHAATAQQ